MSGRLQDPFNSHSENRWTMSLMITKLQELGNKIIS